jgi:S-DNA-T family DNA segregation ATPase FtsK/SpoIIIE
MASSSTKRKSTAASKSARSAAAKQAQAARQARRSNRRQALAVVFLLLGVFSIISYFGATGAFIDLFSALVKGLFGWGFYAVPPVFLMVAAIFAFHRNRPVRFRVVCALLLPAMTGALAHLFSSGKPVVEKISPLKDLWQNGLLLKSGGAVGGFLSELCTYLFSKVGAAIVLICIAVFLLLAALNRTVSGVVDAVRRRARQVMEEPPYYEEPAPVQAPPEKKRSRGRAIDIPLDDGPVPANPVEPLKAKKNEPLYDATPGVRTPDELLETSPAGGKHSAIDIPLDIPFMEKTADKHAEPAKADAPKPSEPAAKPAEPAAKKPQADAAEVGKADAFKAPETTTPEDGGSKPAYVFPPIELLAAGSPAGRTDGAEEVRLNIERLTAAFKSFGVKVRISSYTRGPTVTRYEAELEAGVKLSSLTNLSDDIALSLGASGVRIAAMPGKISTVGIEVPNKIISKVHLRDIIDSQEFKSATSRLTFAIGKNIGGEAVVGDIAKLPHMLVAGTTGSGKSVCLNSLILSILYKATPEEVRFIMVDPKMVEFRVYNGIPHLLVPVVTDVKKASGALQWAVFEMEKRYRMLADANVRDLASYNKLMKKTEGGQTLPQIVIIIDELADLMMMAKNEVEESVIRIAQKGRASGIHLILATQSPRADVITGLMKANIPSRIALKVSSALESRIILDAGGSAEKLVGNGDMLYAPVGAPKPMRIQGTWVSDAEREKVVEFIKQSGDANYSEEVIHEIDKAAEDKSGDSKKDASENGDDYDELLPAAVDVILETGQASVSMLQRRLKLGYSRAARIIDQMEQLKIVGPFEGSKPRQILITRQQWAEMQFIHGTAPTGGPADTQPESTPPDSAEEEENE